MPAELIVLAPKQQAARCRVLGSQREITLRSRDVWKLVPGEIVTIQINKQWNHRGHPYLSGEVAAQRLDVEALGLVPLRLRDEWPWDPAEHCWGEEGEPLEGWAKPIVAAGPRPGARREDRTARIRRKHPPVVRVSVGSGHPGLGVYTGSS